ncbi:hypothetical protein A9179_20305 [Pseudomonas alcaligenes]|uniref:DUF3971 domain-containing protein n=1 Tax=Aquipseudomonas alcaligenes TaxID=43263 RepID=A0ABR7S6L4_AQUAC|nr:hypothetical protein [Pseudomonas alcaligenes]MBC9252614.1 hypothetical protein [Pseudomonas alcaligenes]
MALPALRRRPPALLFTGVALLACLLALGLNYLWQRPAEPLGWLGEWQGKVLQPLAEGQLNLGQLRERLPDGELWVQPRLDGLRLLYRGELLADDLSWRLQAELTLSEAQRTSLGQATGLGPRDAEQPLAAALQEHLGGYPIGALELRPQGEIGAARLAASLGEPRLRLQLPAGEAWVYPQLGLTAHLAAEQLQLLHAVPRSLLQH